MFDWFKIQALSTFGWLGRYRVGSCSAALQSQTNQEFSVCSMRRVTHKIHKHGSQGTMMIPQYNVPNI